MSDAKKTAAVIIAGMGKDDEKPKAPALDGLMEELADALAAKDFAGAAKAFKAANGMCGAPMDEDDSEEL